MNIYLPDDCLIPKELWIRFLWVIIQAKESWILEKHFRRRKSDWEPALSICLWLFVKSENDHRSIMRMVELLYKAGGIIGRSEFEWSYIQVFPPKIIQQCSSVDVNTDFNSFRTIRKEVVKYRKKLFYCPSFLWKFNIERCKWLLNSYIDIWEMDWLVLSTERFYGAEKQIDSMKIFLSERHKLFWENPVHFTTKEFLRYTDNLSSNGCDILSILLFFERNGWIQFHTCCLEDVIDMVRESRFYLKIKKELLLYGEKLSTEHSQKPSMLSYDDIQHELIIGIKHKKLSQKQIVFIEWLLDLREKNTDWWVSLEELAIYDDHSFEEKEEARKEKIIKNFYNIGNHLNKTIKLEMGIEDALETTSRTVRINPKFLS